MGCLAGLDIGSAFAKAVILKDHSIASFSIATTEGNFKRAAEKVLENALQKANLSQSDIEVIGGTGLGTSFIPYSYMRITDILCHSRGVNYLFPTVRTVIEVGNQASKVIKVTPNGKVADCLMSDKCAAGSGRILQIIARVLGIAIDEMGKLSSQSDRPAKFTTGCAVFLETEAISRVAEGTPKADIIAGIHRSIASKTLAMARRLRLEPDYAITGGGAKDEGLVKTMEELLGAPLLVPQEPLITAAIGAALIARERKNHSGEL